MESSEVEIEIFVIKRTMYKEGILHKTRYTKGNHLCTNMIDRQGTSSLNMEFLYLVFSCQMILIIMHISIYCRVWYFS